MSDLSEAKQYVVLDLETTGLEPKSDQIIELAAVLIDGSGKVLDQYESLIQIDRELPPEITDLTSITKDHLAVAGKPLSQVLREFLCFSGDRLLVAHNAEFDFGFLLPALSRYGIAIGNEYVCTLAASRKAWPIFRSHKLGPLAEFLGVTGPSHRALHDCLKAKQVFISAMNSISTNAIFDRLRVRQGIITQINLEFLNDCKERTLLDVWTAPYHHSINAYYPNSARGTGLVFSFDKTLNPDLVIAMEEGRSVSVFAHHIGVGQVGASVEIS